MKEFYQFAIGQGKSAKATVLVVIPLVSSA
jgi:hypothetical protein